MSLPHDPSDTKKLKTYDEVGKKEIITKSTTSTKIRSTVLFAFSSEDDKFHQ